MRERERERDRHKERASEREREKERHLALDPEGNMLRPPHAIRLPTRSYPNEYF